MKKYFQSNFFTVFVLFMIAAAVCVIVYPEIFITFKMSFELWDPYVIDYPLTFVLTNFIYQGGIQLWDFFGQMPYFHTYAVFGLFKFPNVVAAISYYLLAPFSQDSGRFFSQVFSWANMMTLLFIRIAGIFLLLKTVTRNRIILTFGTVIFAVFFSQWAFMYGSFYQSYMPLGMYFIVRFFQEIQWRYLAAFFLFFIVSLGNGIHYSGYMYLPMHFFIIAGILWRIFFNPAPQNPINRHFWRSLQWRNVAWVILAAALIMAPYVYIIKFGFHDIAFGQENSRLAHPFSPQWYFHNPDLTLGDPSSFFSSILSMRTVGSMFYLGISFLFLALAGIILSRNKLRYFFASAIFFLWLLSFPREGLNIGLIAHWINALTNPLKTIPRSYYFACHSMLSYLMMPLIVMGIEAIYELYRGKKSSGFELGLWGGLMILLLLNVIPVLPPEVRHYLIMCTVWLVGAIAWVHFRNSPRARNFLVGTICFLVIIDIVFMVYQSKNTFVQDDYRKPYIFDAFPQSGMVEYDFENPSIFPYRNTYALTFSYRDEGILWFPHSISSDFHHVINQGLNYTYLNGYNPRHKEFAKWLDDPQMLTYLRQNDEFIFLAQAAINASPDALGRICSAGLARQVVEVDDPARQLNLPDQWPGGITGKEEDVFKYDQILGTLDGTDRSDYHLQEGMIIYTLHLPSTFPQHLASSWFLEEQRYLRFFVEGTGQQWQELQAAQGELIRPGTFDVQNIKQGELRAAFSVSDFPMHKKCVLLYPSSENQGVEGLWRRQFDNLGIIYRAKRAGWLVGHYPYDTKWRISVDGKPVTYYRVDKSFIGFPLSQGEHKILIQYWPHSPLRILLLVSAVLVTLGLPLLIFLALKWENKD
jgi:Bacterial membrane protein YfhO